MIQRRPALAAACLAIAIAAAPACSGTALSQGPSDTLRAYSRALQEKRVEDAYKLLSDDAKRSISLDAFRRMVVENPEDVFEVAQALGRPATEPVVTATVTLPSGEDLELTFEDGRWRIGAAAIDLYSQSSPRRALAGFLRAFERGRYDVVLRYVPDAEREGVAVVTVGDGIPVPVTEPPKDPATPSATSPGGVGSGSGELTAEKLKEAWEGPQKKEMQEIAQALIAAFPTATIEETGDVATMAYGSGGTVSFIRERGAWKIRDF